MAWVSPRVYAILSKSEEGKDILEGIADKDQDQVNKEVDAFFGKGGKGFKDAEAYGQAKIDDEAEENAYKQMGDEEVAEHEDAEKEEDWKTTEMASGTLYELGDKRIIKEENEKGDTQYRIDGTNGQVFSSLEEAKNAVMGKKVEIPEDVKEFTDKLYDGIVPNEKPAKEKLILGKKNKDGYKLVEGSKGGYVLIYPDGMYWGGLKSIEEAQEKVNEDDRDYSWMAKTKEKRKQVKQALKRDGWHKEKNSKGYSDNLMSFGDDYGTNFISWEDDEDGLLAIYQPEDGEDEEKEFDNFEDAQKWIEDKMKGKK